ncbi:NYN domain-containing protein [Microbacterium sp.]|uniref:NYN domain-containing protein n=1 Tax=Microbacterium sp. TaxID=51671 RepID=UPI0039E385E8
MRSTCALYVDAGYLLAAAATRVTGTSLRSGIAVRYAQLADALIARAEDAAGLPLLRLHWYDSARGGIPDTTQQEIGLLSRVKLRLGRVGFNGEQKGVDLRIGLDMVAHARHRASDVFILVSGDDDLTEAVEEAQAHGVQVIVLAIPDREGLAHGVSAHLQRAADAVEVFDGALVDENVSKRSMVDTAADAIPTPALLGGHRAPSAASAPAASAASARTPGPRVPARSVDLVYSSATGAIPTQLSRPADDPETIAQIDRVCAQVLTSWLRGGGVGRVHDLQAGRPSIPREVDRALLIDLSDVRGEYDLSDAIRFQLRDRFWHVVDTHDGARAG